MAVARVTKLLVASHKTEELRVLKHLQSKSIAEVKPYIPPAITPQESESVAENLKMIEQTKKALDIIDIYKEKEVKRIASKAGKIVIERQDYNTIINTVDFQSIIEDILNYENEIKFNDSEIYNIESKIKYLKKWQVYKGKIQDLKSTELYTIKLVYLKTKRQAVDKILKGLKENNIAYETIDILNDSVYLILAYHNDFKEEADNYLKEIPFEFAELSEYKDTITHNIQQLEKSLEYHKSRKLNIINLLKQLGKENEKNLIIFLDYLESNLEIENVLSLRLSTEYASFYTVWIKESDKTKFYKDISKFKNIEIYEVAPEEGEEIPIVLENKPLFKPFEVIINLYGVPKYFEIDPTPFVSFFFLIFFGLCLTDAGYGLIFIGISIYMFFKIKNSKKFALLIFLLGLFTIFAGALFNGWFGDLPSYLKIDNFFAKFALFGDPMKSDSGAMNFFRLALLLGVVQVLFGLFVRFFDSLKRKEIKCAFLDTLPWIIIVVCLVIMLLSSNAAVNMQIVDSPIFPASIAKILVWLLIPSALIIILFSARSERSWGFRLFMGFLNLTIVNGITSYLGDFLSYIRLMALGLVTAGIGVAINKIAFQLAGFPIIGIIILIIGLIFGHIFNIGINTLGGFVHTLRLQYVEFFSKFYEGGGKAFEPFKEEHKYVVLLD